MPEALTPLERRVYQYMIDFLAENTYQPSIREIAKRFRIKSTKTVSDLLHALTAKGYIERDQSRSRGVRILGFASAGQVQPVPVRAEAHAPPVDERQRYVTMDRRFLPGDDTFMLRVRDGAMTGRGILDGDYVLVSPSGRVKDGDMVAVQRGPDALIRLLARRGDLLVLESTNPGVPSIELARDEQITILGTIAGVFRPFHEQLPDVVTGVDDTAPLMADVPTPAMPAAVS